MTDPRTFRRRAAALALIPAAAGVFSASLAWSGANDPLATANASTAQTAGPTPTSDPQPTVDPHVSDLTAQVVQAQARIAALQAILDARTAAQAAEVQATAAASAERAAKAAAAPAAKAAPATPKAAAAPAAKPAPAVAATTGASK